MRRQASNGAKNQSASSGGGEGRGGDGDADFERCVEKGVPKSAEEKKGCVLQGKIRQGEKTESKARERRGATARVRGDGETEIRRTRDENVVRARTEK